MKSENQKGVAASVAYGFAPLSYTLRDGRTVTVRSAVADDAQAMLDYTQSALPEVSRYICNTPEECGSTLEEQREQMAAMDSRLGEVWLLPFVGTRLVGSLACSVKRRQRRAHVGNLGMHLHPDFRGHGLGSAMLDGLIVWAQRHPALEMLLLDVYTDNGPALSLYRRAGFVATQAVPRLIKFGSSDYRDVLPMWLDVREEEQR